MRALLCLLLFVMCQCSPLDSDIKKLASMKPPIVVIAKYDSKDQGATRIPHMYIRDIDNKYNCLEGEAMIATYNPGDTLK